MVSITGLWRQTYSADGVWCGEAVFSPTEVRLLKRVLGQGLLLSLSAQAITPHVLSLMCDNKKIRAHNCKMDAPCVSVGEACDPDQWFSSFCSVHSSLQAFLFQIRCMCWPFCLALCSVLPVLFYIQLTRWSKSIHVVKVGWTNVRIGWIILRTCWMWGETLNNFALCNRKNCAQRLTLTLPSVAGIGTNWTSNHLINSSHQLKSSVFFFQFRY